MVKLTKKYKVVAKDNNLIFPVTEEGMANDVYPSAGTEYAEFDTYAEADAYVKRKGFVFVEPENEEYSGFEEI